MQHLLLKRGEELWKLVSEQQASIFVCGGTSMGNDVVKAFESMVCTAQIPLIGHSVSAERVTNN